jgi:hypothetical protein
VTIRNLRRDGTGYAYEIVDGDLVVMQGWSAGSRAEAERGARFMVDNMRVIAVESELPATVDLGGES